MKQESLKVSGTVSRRSYRSIGKYMPSVRYKVCFIAVVVLLDLGLIAGAIALRDVIWLLLPLSLSLAAVAFYRWNLKNVVNRVIASTPAIREGQSFDLDISLDEDAIRVHNRMTELDTALSYELFGSYAVTEDVLALFVKTGTYLLIPASNLSKEKQAEVLALLKRHCPHLRQRRF